MRPHRHLCYHEFILVTCIIIEQPAWLEYFVFWFESHTVAPGCFFVVENFTVNNTQVIIQFVADSRTIPVEHSNWSCDRYAYDIRGELYWGTNAADSNATNAWVDQWIAGGNGDGTLTYSGLPEIIGGTTTIPIASQRLKLIRWAGGSACAKQLQNPS